MATMKSFRIAQGPLLRFAVAGALAFGIAGFAQLSMANTAASASSRLGASNQSDAHTGTSGQAIGASSSQSGSVTGSGTGQSSGNASAAEGMLKTTASGSGSATPYPYNSSGGGAGYARASWNDYLIVGGGGLSGNGYITATLDLSGSLGGGILGGIAQGDGDHSLAQLNILGTGMSGYCGGWNYCEEVYRLTLGVDNNSYSTTIAVNIPVIFGTYQNGLSYTLDVLASASTSYSPYRPHPASSADSFADFTLSWGGITGVFDSHGNSMSGFTVTSASGFDYSQHSAAPIPEPETYTMLLAGLGLLGFAGRRRKQKKLAA